MFLCVPFFFFFFFTDPATTEIYTLSLHDALPIARQASSSAPLSAAWPPDAKPGPDRKSTRLNSSHPSISNAVFCLKKKKKKRNKDALSTKKRYKKKTYKSR